MTIILIITDAIQVYENFKVPMRTSSAHLCTGEKWLQDLLTKDLFAEIFK